jgi:hypothetical protein
MLGERRAGYARSVRYAVNGGRVPRAKKTEKRSPLKEKPLRLPGASLSEERSRILDDELMPLALAIAFAVAFAVLEWFRTFVPSPPQPLAATLVAVLLIAFLVYRLRGTRARLRSLKLGMEGEQAVGQFLEAHRGADWHIFHDVPGPSFNIDHVVVCPKGVFAVETKTFSKPAKGEAKVTYDGDRVLVNGSKPDRDPVAQARAVRDWIRDLLFDTTAIKYPVRGVVVFPGWWVDSPKTGRRPEIWVLNEKAFVKFVENEPVVKSEDVALAASRLVNYITTNSRPA